MMFTNLKKTYDKVHKDILWKYLESRGVHVTYIRMINDVYDGVKIRVRIVRRDLKHFFVKIGWIALGISSHPIFICLSDVWIDTSYPKRSITMYVIVDDIVLIDETHDDCNDRLEVWSWISKCKRFQVDWNASLVTHHMRRMWKWRLIHKLSREKKLQLSWVNNPRRWTEWQWCCHTLD